MKVCIHTYLPDFTARQEPQQCEALSLSVSRGTVSSSSSLQFTTLIAAGVAALAAAVEVTFVSEALRANKFHYGNRECIENVTKLCVAWLFLGLAVAMASRRFSQGLPAQL